MSLSFFLISSLRVNLVSSVLWALPQLKFPLAHAEEGKLIISGSSTMAPLVSESANALRPFIQVIGWMFKPEVPLAGLLTQ